MTSKATCLYNLDFSDKWRDLTLQSRLQGQAKDLTLQSRLQGQAKGPHFTILTSMTSEGPSLYRPDFTDKQRDLNLQSRLHWQVKGPHFTIYRTWNVLQGNSMFSCHDAVYVTLHRKAQPFLALAGKQALVHCSARLQENLGARITKQQSTSNLFSQQHLSHTIIMYVTDSNNKNIHTQKQDPQNIHC